MRNPLKKQSEEEKRTGDEFDATGMKRALSWHSIAPFEEEY
jgi:hypothetical protein